ncbi:MAG: heme exporter protein CcmD [Burkholderiaceae bacterium]|jgi:heme exporter protein CcmD
MDWTRLIGYGPYVWGAYGAVALALVLELASLKLSRRQTGDALRDAQLLDQLARRERAQTKAGSP